jgi:prepilin peptidase CpaA
MWPIALAFAAIGLALLTAAAWRDLTTRTIPDTICLLLLAAGVLAQLPNGISAVVASAATALLLFAVLFAAFARGLLGGGDVKLITALAVGLSPYDCYRLVVATAFAGGFLALAYLLLSRTVRAAPTITRRSLFRRILAVEGWRIRRHGPLPYGVAIAVGGAFVLLQPGSY